MTVDEIHGMLAKAEEDWQGRVAQAQSTIERLTVDLETANRALVSANAELGRIRSVASKFGQFRKEENAKRGMAE